MKLTVGYFLISEVIKNLYVSLFLCYFFGRGRGEGKHLSGDLCKSGVRHFTPEKGFASNFTH